MYMLTYVEHPGVPSNCQTNRTKTNRCEVGTPDAGRWTVDTGQSGQSVDCLLLTGPGTGTGTQAKAKANQRRNQKQRQRRASRANQTEPNQTENRTVVATAAFAWGHCEKFVNKKQAKIVDFVWVYNNVSILIVED